MKDIQIYGRQLTSDRKFPDYLTYELIQYDSQLRVGWNNVYKVWELWRFSRGKNHFLFYFPQYLKFGPGGLKNWLRKRDTFGYKKPLGKMDEIDAAEAARARNRRKGFQTDVADASADTHSFAVGIPQFGWEPGMDKEKSE